MTNKERNMLIAQELRGLADVVMNADCKVSVAINAMPSPSQFQATVSDFLPSAKLSKSTRAVGRELFGGLMDIRVTRGDA